MKCAWCGQTHTGQAETCELCGRPANTAPRRPLAQGVQGGSGVVSWARRNPRVVMIAVAVLLLIIVVPSALRAIQGGLDASRAAGAAALPPWPEQAVACNDHVAVEGEATCEFALAIHEAYLPVAPAPVTPEDPDEPADPDADPDAVVTPEPVVLDGVVDPIREEAFQVACTPGAITICQVTEPDAVLIR